MTNSDYFSRLGLLTIRADGDDLAQLRPDPRHFMAIPSSRKQRMRGLITIIILTAIAASISVRTYDPAQTLDIQILIIAGIFTIPIACWIGFFVAGHGAPARRDFAAQYEHFAASRPRPVLGTVKKVEFGAGEYHMVFSCDVTIELDSRHTLDASMAKRLAHLDKNGEKIGRLSTLTPQYGDRVAVFIDTTGKLPPLVQANHSWGRTHAHQPHESD